MGQKRWRGGVPGALRVARNTSGVLEGIKEPIAHCSNYYVTDCHSH